MSASLDNVKITNMNKCLNLINLHTESNTYTKNDIESLHNLKRIYSDRDKYESNDSCLFEELFKNNKLEYIHVYTLYADRNIVKSMVLSNNIANLRYMYIYQGEVKYDIKLDISNEYP